MFAQMEDADLMTSVSVFTIDVLHYKKYHFFPTN